MYRVCRAAYETSLLPFRLARSYTTFVKDCLVEAAWRKPKSPAEDKQIDDQPQGDEVLTCRTMPTDSSQPHVTRATRAPGSGSELVPCPGAFAETQHGRTHYLLMGPEDGELIVFSHGVSLFSFVWTKLGRYLTSKGYRVLMYDFYGHGYSSTPTLNYTVDLYRTQLEELLESLGLVKGPKSVVLVGHSMGGLVSCEFSAKHPDLVRKLILINSVGLPVKPSYAYWLATLMHVGLHIVRKTSLADRPIHLLANWFKKQADRDTTTYEELCVVAHNLDEGEISEIEAEILTHSKAASNLLHRASQLILPGSTVRFFRSLYFLYHTWVHQMKINNDRPKVVLSILRNLPLIDANHSENISYLHKIEEIDPSKTKIPILIVWGENDGITPVTLLSDFQKHVPHAEVLTIPETDHSVFLQQPAQIFKTMLSFLNNDPTTAQELEQDVKEEEESAESEGSNL